MQSRHYLHYIYISYRKAYMTSSEGGAEETVTIYVHRPECIYCRKVEAHSHRIVTTRPVLTVG